MRRGPSFLLLFLIPLMLAILTGLLPARNRKLQKPRYEEAMKSCRDNFDITLYDADKLSSVNLVFIGWQHRQDEFEEQNLLKVANCIDELTNDGDILALERDVNTKNTPCGHYYFPFFPFSRFDQRLTCKGFSQISKQTRIINQLRFEYSFLVEMVQTVFMNHHDFQSAISISIGQIDQIISSMENILLNEEKDVDPLILKKFLTRIKNLDSSSIETKLNEYLFNHEQKLQYFLSHISETRLSETNPHIEKHIREVHSQKHRIVFFGGFKHFSEQDNGEFMQSITEPNARLTLRES